MWPSTSRSHHVCQAVGFKTCSDGRDYRWHVHKYLTVNDLNIYQNVRCQSVNNLYPGEIRLQCVLSKPGVLWGLCEQIFTADVIQCIRVKCVQNVSISYTVWTEVQVWKVYLVWAAEGSWLPPGHEAAGPAVGCAASGLPAWYPFFPAFCLSISSEPALHGGKRKRKQGWRLRTVGAVRRPVGIQHALLETL